MDTIDQRMQESRAKIIKILRLPETVTDAEITDRVDQLMKNKRWFKLQSQKAIKTLSKELDNFFKSIEGNAIL